VSLTSRTAIGTSDVASFESSPFDLSDSTTSMLDEDEEYEDAVLYERRGTPVLRSARPELVVPTPWMCRRWTGALNSRLWPRACAETGKRASMVAEPRPRFSPRCLGWYADTNNCDLYF